MDKLVFEMSEEQGESPDECCGGMIGCIKPDCHFPTWKMRSYTCYPHMHPFACVGTSPCCDKGKGCCPANWSYRFPPRGAYWLTNTVDGRPCCSR